MRPNPARPRPILIAFALAAMLAAACTSASGLTGPTPSGTAGPSGSPSPGPDLTQARAGEGTPQAPGVHRPGEPLVRSLLRDVPGRRGHPDAQRQADGLCARPDRRTMRPSVSHDRAASGGGPARPATLGCSTSTAARWTGSSGPSSTARCTAPIIARDPKCAELPRAAGPAGRHELPHGQGDPELLAVREGVRPAGPHVRARRFVDPAGAPVPRVGVGRPLLRSPRPDVLRLGPLPRR